jgi:hypothetical protein
MTIVNLQPKVLDLLLYAGDGASFRVIATNDAGQPIPLTGTIKAQIRKKREDIDPMATFTVDLTEAAQGIAILSLTGEQTQSLIGTPEKKFIGVWDIEWTYSASQPRTLCQGRVECVLDVSR